MSAASADDLADSKTRTFTFTLILGGIDEMTEEFASSVYARCDDAMCGEHCGRPYVTFERESVRLAAAIVPAIQQVESAIPGARVIEVRSPEIVVIDLVNDLLRMRADDSKSAVAEQMWQVLIQDKEFTGS